MNTLQGKTTWKHQWRRVIRLWQNETGWLRISFNILYHTTVYCTKKKWERTGWLTMIKSVYKEILEEVVRELQKVKEEIIDGKFSGIQDH